MPPQTFNPPFLPELDASSWNCERYSPDLHQQRLAKFGIGQLQDRSLALLDLLAALGQSDPHTKLLATLAVPGDIKVF